MIFLGIRHILARRKQSIFTILGIFFGTTAFVVISGLMLGFREYLLSELIHNDAHVHITAREEFIEEHSFDSFFSKKGEHLFWNPAPSGRKNGAGVENPEKWIKILKQDPRVSLFSPLSSTMASMRFGKGDIGGCLIGCNPELQKNMNSAGSHVIEGRFEDLSMGGHSLAIGEQIQKKLGVKYHQTVMISLPNNSETPFKVVAIFKTDNPMIDFLSYCSLEDVQTLKKMPHQITEIAVKLHDHMTASSLATTWSHFGLEKIESWDQIHANLFMMMAFQDAIRFLAVGGILIVAGFGIFNVLNMSVLQKRKDVAILRSMGYTAKDIILLFFCQGLILGIIGSSLGLLVGHVICLYLQTLPMGKGGVHHFGPGHMLISFNTIIYAQAVMMGLFSSCLASILPARSAGKLSPIEIIRSGAE